MNTTPPNDLERVNADFAAARTEIADTFERGDVPDDDALERFWSARDDAERYGIL